MGVLNPLQKILNEAQMHSEWYKYYEKDLERKKVSKMCGKTLESYAANRKKIPQNQKDKTKKIHDN